MDIARLEPWEPGKCVLGLSEVDREMRNTTQRMRMNAPSDETAYIAALSLMHLRTKVATSITDKAITNMMKESKET